MRSSFLSLVVFAFFTTDHHQAEAQSLSTIGQSTMSKWRDASDYAPDLAKK
jgi:hypothetical protein